MSLQLRIDELQEALANANHPAAEGFERLLCGAADAMAALLAAQYGIERGNASQQGKGFAGICVPFRPSFQGQPFPDDLEQFDDGGREDWAHDATDTELPAAPVAKPQRFVVEPQRDSFKGTDEGAGGSTWFIACEPDEAEHWALIDRELGDVLDDYPTRELAEARATEMNERGGIF